MDRPEPPTVYAVLNSYVNFGKEEQTKIADLPRVGREVFFDFDYPLAEGMTKEYFETQILKHFLERRIGRETVTAFKIALDAKLNEIMPMYNKLFTAIKDWDLFSDGEVVTRDLQDAKTSTANSTVNTNGGSDSTSDQRFSDTPQSALTDVQNGTYVTNYSYNQDNGTVYSDTTSNNTTNDNDTVHEVTKRTPADKLSLYENFIKAKQNIFTMIYKDLDELFYQIIY